MVLHASFSFLIKSSSKLLVTSTGIKAWTSSISGLWFPWPIYMFLEMRFDLGTLDSGERSLPFGLLIESFSCIFLLILSSTITFKLLHALFQYYADSIKKSSCLAASYNIDIKTFGRKWRQMLTWRQINVMHESRLTETTFLAQVRFMKIPVGYARNKLFFLKNIYKFTSSFLYWTLLCLSI